MLQLLRYSMILTLFLFACNAQNTPKINDSVAESAIQELTKVPRPEKGFYNGFLDSKGTLWFASRGNGVFKYDGNTFTNYTQKDGLCDDDISCIAEDSKGNLWFGTTNGLCHYDGKTFSHLAIPQSDTSSIWLDEVYPVVNPNQVMSVLEDKNGMLWIGTNGAGVYRYDGARFTQFLSNVGMVYDDGQQHNIILSIIEDLSGNIWFSSLSHGGVSRFDGETFTHFVDELSDDFIRVVFCDQKGNIWIGTHGNHNGGLDRYDGKRFMAFHKTNDGFLHNNVCNIYEDKTGKLWMASGTTYLSIFDGEHFKTFTTNDGQKFDKIQFVVEGPKGNIWFGNRHGLWRFNGETVTNMVQD